MPTAGSAKFSINRRTEFGYNIAEACEKTDAFASQVRNAGTESGNLAAVFAKGQYSNTVSVSQLLSGLSGSIF